MSKITIIIPIYNAEKTLEKCLQSIFNQAFQNFEIITVNDGSTDSSAEILEKYKDKIKTVISQENQGAAAARNAGAKKADSPFIIFCDADVLMKPQMLETMLKMIEQNPHASYVYSSFKFGKKTFKLWPFNIKKLKEMPYIHTTSLIRAEHFSGFDEKLKRFQDWDLWLTMLAEDHVGHFIPEVLFRVLPGGTMSVWVPKFWFKLFGESEKVRKYKDAEEIIKKKHNL